MITSRLGLLYKNGSTGFIIQIHPFVHFFSYIHDISYTGYMIKVRIFCPCFYKKKKLYYVNKEN